MPSLLNTNTLQTRACRVPEYLPVVASTNRWIIYDYTNLVLLVVEVATRKRLHWFDVIEQVTAHFSRAILTL